MRLILIRHGESLHSQRGLVAGPLGCPGLTDTGIEQATTLGRRMAADGARVDVLLSSTTLRARQTAELLSSSVGSPVQADCDLCEPHPGEGDGLPATEFARRYGSFDPPAEPDRALSPGGESWNGFLARIRRTIDELPHRYAGQNVVAVTHAGFIVWTFFMLLGVPRPGTGTRIEPGYASRTEWDYDRLGGTWTLRSFNEGSATAARP